MSEPSRICILGGGIMGLTTCCYFLKTYPSSGITITLISDKFSPNNTSAVAAGYWHSPDEEHLTRLALHSYDIFLSESYSIKAHDAGVMSMTSYVLHGSDGKYSKPDYIPNDNPLFSSYVKHFHRLTNEELQMFNTLRPVSGYSFTTVVVETKKYLNCLMVYLKHQSNVKFIQKHVKNFDELSSIETFDVIVNCTGLGARELVLHDAANMYGGRGQIVHICAPHIKSVYLFDGGLGYIIPQTDYVVLGGTNEINNDSNEVNSAQTIEILQKSRKIFPSLANNQIKKVCVGFRPIRKINDMKTVRIEADREKRNLIHNYGHAADGITLSWGSARQVVGLSQSFISTRRSDQSENEHSIEHETLWKTIG